MSGRKLAIVALAFATLAVASSAARAGLIGPSPYLSSADSPFNSLTFTYFHLESFEDGALNTPGVTVAPANLSVINPSDFTDSVDGDDGAIDGLGRLGRSLFGGGPIVFTFNATALGSLPTHAGIVWTDGQGDITFEAFDQNGTSLGTLIGTHAGGSFTGETAEDRFYGATHAGGISRISITTPGSMEVDHLQYGAVPALQAVPEPTSLVLLGIGALGLCGFARRRRKEGADRSSAEGRTDLDRAAREGDFAG